MKFQLVVRPDGRAFLTTPDPLTATAAQSIRDAIRAWEDGRYPVALIAECEVVQVADIEIDIPEAVGS